MQFSVAPWRTLDQAGANLCRDAAWLHVHHGERTYALARQSALTGEPIAKPLAWLWPNQGYEDVRDQFMLGDNLLVAPVVVKGARSRRVIFPPGRWRGDDGSDVKGPAQMEISAPLERLPRFEKQS